MDWIVVLGLVAGTLTTISVLPQVIHTWKTKSAKDLSWAALITLSLGNLVWLAYGIFRNDITIIIANAVTFILVSTIVLLKYRHHEKT